MNINVHALDAIRNPTPVFTRPVTFDILSWKHNILILGQQINEYKT
jgi:hypothetical protein